MNAPITPQQWARIREMVEVHTGMNLGDKRILRLREAVDKMLAEDKGPHDLESILSNPNRRTVFLEQLTARMTVGETYFLRNEHHFHVLREHVIPQILQENASKHEVRIWAAGCATGEEPYSLAIVLHQLLGDNHHWHVSILGTDLNPEFLEQARHACFRPWSFRGTDIHQDRNYFEADRDVYRLTARVRKYVHFSYLNLVKDVYPSSLNGTLGLDLIVFRNVAIYLKREVVDGIVARFYDALRPGGWLLLGEAEITLAETRQFEARRFPHATFLRKSEQRAARHVPAVPRTAAPVLPAPTGSPISDSDARPLMPSAARVDDQQTQSDDFWGRIEDHITSQQFEAAQHIIDDICIRQLRAALRLRYATALIGYAEIPRAMQMLEKCLEEEPLWIEPHLLKAGVAEENGRLDEAERACRQALYLDRNCVIAHFHLAGLLQQTGDPRGARKSLDTVLRLGCERDPHALVEHGDGVCYGRLQEMASVLLGGLQE
jgi:chemotaxis protein methyltransferase CheR